MDVLADMANKPKLVVDSGFTKIKSALKPKKATVVGPAGMAPTRHSVALVNGSIIKPLEVTEDVSDTPDAKRPKIQNEASLTIEERLKSSVSECTAPTSSVQPTSDSLTHVLVQGLQSRDKQMLETVFTNTDERVIQNTIKKLPIDCISGLLSELQTCLFNKSENTFVYAKWLEQLLNLRLTFLLTLPNVEEDFAPLLELLNARTRILERIHRLKGRLNLIISQIRTQNNTTALTRSKPMVDYESSSSEESDYDDIIDDKLKDDDSEEDMSDDKKDSDSSGDEDMASNKDEDEADHQSSDDTIDNLMSEYEDDYDSTKVNGIETDE